MTGRDMVKVTLADTTVTIDRYVIFDEDRHGKPRWYFRKRGQKKVRLRSKPGTEAFLAEYRAACAGEHPDQIKARPKAGTADTAPQAPRCAPVEAGSLRWLFNEYMAQALEWRTQGKTTKDRRRTVFNQICDEPVSETNPAKFGDQPFRQMKARHMRVICSRRATMATVNARVKAFRRVFHWAATKGELLDVDPALALEYWREASEGFHTWTVDEVRQYWKRHETGTMARLAIDLLLMTGARRSDVVTFGRQHVKNGELTFTQIKGQKHKRKTLTLPILPALQSSIEATAKACGTKGLTFLHTAYGKPITAKGFGNWFRKRCTEAGLSKRCSAHGLRKAGSTILAEAGATSHQLMAIYGWDTLKQAELYTRAAEQAKMARTAMAKVIPIELQDDANVGTTERVNSTIVND